MAQPREDAATIMARTLRRVAVAALCLALLALFGLWRIDNPRAERLRMAISDSAAPLLDSAARPLADAMQMVDEIDRFADVYGQNRELRREIQRLRAWRDAAQELERENARLRALSNLALAPRMGFAAGEIVGDAGGPFVHSVLVNIGSEDGVADGAAVIDGSGLVGRVVGVGETVSRVLLLTDFSSRLPVKALPSGRRAILIGDATEAPRLAFLSEAEDLNVGDLVVTSGDGGVLPPDIPVGAIAALGERSARVRPHADYRRLEFVRVLRWRREAPAAGPGELILPPTSSTPAAPPILGELD